MTSLQITKANGDREDFNENKLLYSLNRAQLPSDSSQRLLQVIKPKLKPSLTSQQLHALVSQQLAHIAQPIHFANYNLKQAVMKLGPSGFPFERYVAGVLNELGFQTSVGQIMTGYCINHEVDIEAIKGDSHYLIECKFHQYPGNKTDAQVALYTYARFQDIIRYCQSEHQNHYPWIITNTKVTLDAMDYSLCQKMKLTSWGYPENDNLYTMIISSRLYPVTVLNSLSADQQANLLSRDVVSLKDLKLRLSHKSLIDVIPSSRSQAVINEIDQIIDAQ